METLSQPTLLLKPFADSGDRNTIPETNSDVSNPQLADLTNGFPQITSESPDNGGLPPERKDFNGLGYLTTTYDYFAQAGGKYTFNQTVSDAIGGYPLNARLWYLDNGVSYILRSTKANNGDNFVTNPSYIGTSWVKDTPTMTDLSDIIQAIYPIGSIYIGTQSTCPMAVLIPNSTWELVAVNRALWGGNGTNANTEIAAGLPNITGTLGGAAYTKYSGGYSWTGAFENKGDIHQIGHDGAYGAFRNTQFDASKSNSIYGNSDTVQPPAYVVNVWRRTA